MQLIRVPVSQIALQRRRPCVVPSRCAWAPFARHGFSSHGSTSDIGGYGQAETVRLIISINDRDARINGLCGKQGSGEGCWAGKGR